MDLIQHLKDRGMNPSLYQVHYDNEQNIVTFYLYNFSGIIVGYQQYRPDKVEKKVNDPKEGRYFTYLPRQVDGLFGLEVLNPTIKTIYIVEGIFKAAVLHRLGYNAIAVLTSSPKRLKTLFRILKQTYTLIAIGDNDNGGSLLINSVKKGSKSPKDLDEMSDKDIINFINTI